MPAVAVPLAIERVDAVHVERARSSRRRRRARPASSPAITRSQPAKRRRDAAGHDVGVDVEHRRGLAAVCIDPEARDHRHVAVHEQQLDERRVGLDRIADEAEIHDRAGRRPMRARPASRVRNPHPRPSVRRPGRPAPTSAATSSVFDAPAEHGDDDVERGRIGHAQAVDLLRRDAAIATSSASIARPPPWITTSGRSRRDRRGERGDARAIGRRFEQLAAELEHQRRRSQQRRPFVEAAARR